MTRQRPLARRASHIAEIVHEMGAQPMTATVGFAETGEPNEIFLDLPKTSPMSEIARDVALLISIALQNGVSIEEMRAGVGRSSDGQPHTLAGRALDHLAGLQP